MLKIYHNPQCSKSREGLSILDETNLAFETVEYLKSGVTYTEIESLLCALGIKPIELIRKNETIWKEQFKGKELTDQQIIQAMVEFPKLIERPIVVKDNQAIIGRPPQLIKDLLSKQ